MSNNRELLLEKVINKLMKERFHWWIYFNIKKIDFYLNQDFQISGELKVDFDWVYETFITTFTTENPSKQQFLDHYSLRLSNVLNKRNGSEIIKSIIVNAVNAVYSDKEGFQDYAYLNNIFLTYEPSEDIS